MNKDGILLVISGPSGCGKGTVINELLQGTKQVFLSVSATTRAPREGEKAGEQYFFLTKEEFEHEIKTDGMLEYASYCGNYYGTPKRPVIDSMAAGKDIILEIEVQGAMQVMASKADAVSIFIMPPSLSELEHRLVDRKTEDIETINKRLKTAKEEIKLCEKYDYIVVNNTVVEAAEEIKAIILAEKTKVKRMKKFLGEILYSNFSFCRP